MRRHLLMASQQMGYITNGLVFHLDGIEKGETAGSWTDLVGGKVFKNYDAVPLADGWELKNKINSNPVSYLSFGKTLSYSWDKYTIEAAFRCKGFNPASVNYMVFSTNTLNSVCVGSIRQNPTQNLLCFKHTGNYLSFDWNPAKENELILTSCAKDTAICNGTSLESVDLQYWDGRGEAMVGGRLGTTASFVGVVHSIRIYDRLLTEEEMIENQKTDKARFGL